MKPLASLIDNPFYPKGCEGVVFKMAIQDPTFIQSLTKWVSQASQGETFALVQLAVIHRRGGQVLEAARLIKLAAEMGNAEAMARYAIMLVEGSGVVQDLPRAAHYYGEAARQSHPIGTYGLACCYLNGTGVPKDPAAGVHLMKTAAALGHPPAIAYMKKPWAKATDAKLPKWS